MSRMQALFRWLGVKQSTPEDRNEHQASLEADRLRRQHAEDNTRMHMGPLSVSHRTDSSQPYSPGHSSGL